MIAPPFSPYDLEDDLQKGDQFTKAQAEVMARALSRTAYRDLVTRTDLKDLEQRLTIRLGGITVAGVVFLAAIKFFG